MSKHPGPTGPEPSLSFSVGSRLIRLGLSVDPSCSRIGGVRPLGAPEGTGQVPGSSPAVPGLTGPHCVATRGHFPSAGSSQGALPQSLLHRSVLAAEPGALQKGSGRTGAGDVCASLSQNEQFPGSDRSSGLRCISEGRSPPTPAPREAVLPVGTSLPRAAGCCFPSLELQPLLPLASGPHRRRPAV